jgi:uncharacterized protein YndB with AHSA1/START domain
VTDDRGRHAVRSDRRWDIDAGRDEVWTALTAVDQYRAWWPWLRRFEANAFAQGERWRCTVKPQLPYRLHFDIVLQTVVERELAVAHLEGDLDGWARLSLDDDRDGCQLQLISELEAVAGPVRVAARLAPRITSAGHDWVLDRGIRQFRAKALSGSPPW